MIPTVDPRRPTLGASRAPRVLFVLAMLLVVATAHAQAIAVILDDKTVHTLARVETIAPAPARCVVSIRDTINGFLTHDRVAVADDGQLRDAGGASLQKDLVFFGCVRPVHLDTAPETTRKELSEAFAEAQRMQHGAFAVVASAGTTPSGARSATEWRGAGSKTTDTFTATAPWRIHWSALPSAGRAGGRVLIAVYDAEGIVTSIDSGSVTGAAVDVSTVHKSGTFYLDISGFGVSWLVFVE